MINQRVEPRSTGEALLRLLAQEFPAEAGVVEGRMFNGQGLKVGDGFFAFISHTGELVVKLSQPEATRLVDDHQAEPMTMGKRTLREWVRIPLPDPDQIDHWRVTVQRGWEIATRSTTRA